MALAAQLAYQWDCMGMCRLWSADITEVTTSAGLAWH